MPCCLVDARVAGMARYRWSSRQDLIGTQSTFWQELSLSSLIKYPSFRASEFFLITGLLLFSHHRWLRATSGRSHHRREFQFIWRVLHGYVTVLLLPWLANPFLPAPRAIRFSWFSPLVLAIKLLSSRECNWNSAGRRCIPRNCDEISSAHWWKQIFCSDNGLIALLPILKLLVTCSALTYSNNVL